MRGMMRTRWSSRSEGGEDVGRCAALAKHPRALFTVMALSAGGALSLYSFTTYMQKYLVNTAVG